MFPERKLPRPFQLPWGKGQVVEEVSIAHDHWAPTVQLLEYDDGQVGARFCNYSAGGRFQRQASIWTEEDFAAFGAELSRAPRLRELISRMVC
jgi:hypothetical protein